MTNPTPLTQEQLQPGTKVLCDLYPLQVLTVIRTQTEHDGSLDVLVTTLNSQVWIGANQLTLPTVEDMQEEIDGLRDACAMLTGQRTRYAQAERKRMGDRIALLLRLLEQRGVTGY